jgi:hypothetical protein
MKILALFLAVFACVSLGLGGQPLVRLFRSADESTIIKIVSPDHLELNTSDGPATCTYSRDGGSLRAVSTGLGGVRVLILKMAPTGLVMSDGTMLYDESHFQEAARKYRRHHP